MEFTITIRFEKSTLNIKVRRIYQSDQIERYELTTQGRLIVLRNNRPFLKSTGSRKKPEWKLEQGKMINEYSLKEMIEKLQERIEYIENPPVKWIHPKNN